MFTHTKEHASISSGTVLKALILGLFTVLFSFAGTASAAPASVANLTELTTALADPSVETITLTADISGITETLVIPVGHPLTLNGGGFTLSFTGLEGGPAGVDDGLTIQDVATINNLTVDAGLATPSAWVGTYAIQVYNTTATLNNVTVRNGNGGILANNSPVTLTGTINVSNNGFGGAEASGASGSLSIGSATFTNSSEEYGLPTVWEDGLTGTAVTGYEANFTRITKGSQYQYYLVLANTIDPSLKDITSFSFPGRTGVIGVNTIAVAVPLLTDVTTLVPTISITGASVSPDTGVAQDFTSPVVYTVTAADASTKDYTVTVTPTAPVLTSINVTPTNSTIDVGETQAYTPTGVDQFGDTMSLTVDSVDSSDPLVATTDSSMFSATGVAPGSVTITVTSGLVSSLPSNLTVVLPDLTPPVITLLGGTPIDVESNSLYTDAGATALDDVDGDITGSIITVNPVDTSILGIYTVTFNVSDAAGNPAIPVARTVNVVDTIAPVITLNGADPQIIQRGAGYTELGATADDGSTVVIDTSTFVDAVGSYMITYSATDGAGNSALPVARIVNVIDTIAPVIAFTTTIPTLTNNTTPSFTFSTDENGSINLSGIDCAHGLGSQTLATVAQSPNIPIVIDTLAEGTYTCTVSVADAEFNVSNSLVSTFTVDTTNPTATVSYDVTTPTNGSVVATIAPSEAINEGLTHTFTDNGSYTFNFTDLAGNAGSVDATVSNIDLIAPTVTAVDSDGDLYNTLTVSPVTIMVTFSEDVSVAPDISVSGGAQAVNNCGDGDAKTFCFNYTVPPTQDTEKEIQIMNAEDAVGNVMFDNFTHTFLVDTIVPVITLNGADPQTIEWGDGYTEPGATADDGSTVIIDSSAFVDAVGLYSVTYSATDVSGNPAMTIMRTVEVVDTTIPTATVSYDVTTPTNGSVVATITPSEPVTGALTHTFTVNGTFTFDFTDPSGNAGSVDATVSNIDIVAPVITLLGTTPITVEYNSVYSDAGATALDDVDGVITGSIVTNNPVDTHVPGVYTVTYDVFDAVGNPAIQVTRSVTVSNPPSTGSRARRALPVFPVVPSANVNVAGGLFTFMRHLGLGLSGEDVTALQNRLMAEGVFSGPVTGYFGPLTLGAVQSYQRKMGISDTGFVGPLTLARLNQGLALGNPSSNPLTAEQITERRTQLLGLLQQLLRLLQAQRDAQ